jgi:hypothetical protein
MDDETRTREYDAILRASPDERDPTMLTLGQTSSFALYSAHDIIQGMRERDYNSQGVVNYLKLIAKLATGRRGQGASSHAPEGDEETSRADDEDVQAMTSGFDVKHFLRELIQNAVDVAEADKTTQLLVEIGEDSLLFQHNGRPFRGLQDDMTIREGPALVEIGHSTKTADASTTGQFGVGFKGWAWLFEKVEVCSHEDEETAAFTWFKENRGKWNSTIEFRPREDKVYTTSFRFSGFNGEVSHLLSDGFRESVVGTLANQLLVEQSEYRIEIRSEGSEPLNLSFENTPIDEHVVSRRLTYCVGHQVSHKADFLMAKAPLQPLTPLLEQAFQAFLDENSEVYERANEQNNPYANMTPETWTEHLHLFLITPSPNNDPEMASTVLDEPTWLRRRASVDKGFDNTDVLLQSKTGVDWAIDAPFFLTTDREGLNQENAQKDGNLELVRVAYERLMPVMVAAFEAKHLDSSGLYRTPKRLPKKGDPAIVDALIESAHEGEVPWLNSLLESVEMFYDANAEILGPSVARIVPHKMVRREGARPIRLIEALATVTDGSGALVRALPMLPHHSNGTGQRALLQRTLGSIEDTLLVHAPELATIEVFQRLEEAEVEEE